MPAGIKDSELFNLINEVEINCPVCLKYKKAPLKPVVGFSLSKDFKCNSNGLEGN